MEIFDDQIIDDNSIPLLSGCPDQAERFDEQVPNDQQPGEQDQLPEEAGHDHPRGCDWTVPCLHALVHIWLEAS